VEIGERARAEGALSASLREKEVLLKEIHHRVKNNLQVITSVLNLPMRYIADQRAVTVLKETSNRVKSIAILHEILYKSSDLSKVPVSGYIQSLITHLVSSYDVSGETVSISIEVEDILVNIDTGISCGLLINELVSNSLRHAFPAGRKGRVWVRLSEQGDRICLTVGDDGVGIPEEYDPHSAETLGLKIVDTLTRQLNGKLELKRGYGTEFSVTFGDRD
jgi:two-component sensor histidine kinase